MIAEKLEQYIRKTHTAQTTFTYVNDIANFKALNRKARWYKRNDIINFLEELSKRKESHSSITRKLAALKCYYSFLLDTGKRMDHPCKKLTIKGDRNRQIQTQDLFSMEELQLLFQRENRYKVLEIRNKLLLSFLVYQALTSEELTRLTLKDIDLDNGTIYVKASKTLHRRTLELQRTQFSLIIKYLDEIRPQLLKQSTNVFFLSKLGIPMTVDSIHSMFEQFRDSYPERKISPQVMRQSVISHWLNIRKIKLEDVQQMAGHKYPSSTEKYRIKDSKLERELINKFHPLMQMN